MNKKPKLGDVFQIDIGQRRAFFQYVEKDPQQADLVAVLPGVHDRTQEGSALKELIEGETAYYVFIPLGPSLKDGEVEFVCSAAIPAEREEPPLLSPPIQGMQSDWELWEDG